MFKIFAEKYFQSIKSLAWRSPTKAYFGNILKSCPMDPAGARLVKTPVNQLSPNLPKFTGSEIYFIFAKFVF